MVALHFQEWWIRHRAALPCTSITPSARRTSTAGPGRWARSPMPTDPPRAVDPVVSIGTVAGRARHPGGVAAAAGAGGRGVAADRRGAGARPRQRRLAAIGVRPDAEAVGRHYGGGTTDGLLDGRLVAEGERGRGAGRVWWRRRRC